MLDPVPILAKLQWSTLLSFGPQVLALSVTILTILSCVV